MSQRCKHVRTKVTTRSHVKHVSPPVVRLRRRGCQGEDAVACSHPEAKVAGETCTLISCEPDIAALCWPDDQVPREPKKPRVSTSEQCDAHVASPAGDVSQFNVIYNFVLSKVRDSPQRDKISVFCVTCLRQFSHHDYFTQHLPRCYQNQHFRCPFCSVDKNCILGCHDGFLGHMKKHFVYLSKKLDKCSKCGRCFFGTYNKCLHISHCH